jgi:hypothetical protein
MDRNLQFTANNGIALVSVANANLNGTGVLANVLTSPAVGNDGTTIYSITIKATGNTSLGMVRFFLKDGVNYFLIREVMIPANTQTGVVPAFSVVLNDRITLKPGYSLWASTQVAQNFNIIANGRDWLNCSC